MIFFSQTFLTKYFNSLELAPQRPSTSTEARRKEATAVVLLGVIGAEFGQDIEVSAIKRKASAGGESKKRGSVVEGFGIGAAGTNLARYTSNLTKCTAH